MRAVWAGQRARLHACLGTWLRRGAVAQPACRFTGVAPLASGQPTEQEEYLQTASGARLAYHRTPVASSCRWRSGVIFCGGMASNMNGRKALALEEHAHRCGHAFIRFDCRGHGMSSGRYQDTLDIIDHVAAPGGHVIVGSSIGAWIALKVAASRRERIKGLILLAPAVDITELWFNSMDEQMKQLASSTGFCHLEGLSFRTEFFSEATEHYLLDLSAREVQVRCATRLLHGLQDRIVPHAVSAKVFYWLEAQDVHMTLLKDGDHRLSRPQDLALILRTVEEVLDAAEHC